MRAGHRDLHAPFHESPAELKLSKVSVFLKSILLKLPIQRVDLIRASPGVSFSEEEE